MKENSHIEELIIKYLSQNIEVDELLELKKWVDKSPENKTLFFQLKEVSDIASSDSLSEQEMDASWERMLKCIESNTDTQPVSKPQTKRIAIWRSALKYSAIVALFITGWGVIKYVENYWKSLQGISEVQFNEIVVKKGGRGSSITLSDGTKVKLNAYTTFKYPSSFDKTERSVFLDGEAMFEVIKNDDKPFVINLKDKKIKVLGTTFNIESYSDDEQSFITLVSGSILLETSKRDHDKSTIDSTFLKPQQQAIVNNKTGEVVLRNIDTSFSESWIHEEYKFKDETLFTIANRLEKYYNIKIHLENRAMEEMKFTGTFSLNQGIQEILQLIDYKNNFKIDWMDGEVYIKYK